MRGASNDLILWKKSTIAVNAIGEWSSINNPVYDWKNVNGMCHKRDRPVILFYIAFYKNAVSLMYSCESDSFDMTLYKNNPVIASSNLPNGERLLNLRNPIVIWLNSVSKWLLFVSGTDTAIH